MVKSLLRFGVLAAACVAGGCSRPDPAATATGRAAGKTEIRFAHVHAPDVSSELHYSAVTFAESLASLTNQVEAKVYPQGTLGSEREVYEGMQLGSGPALTVTGTAILNNFDQRIGVLDLPYLWKDYDHVHRVLDGEVGRELAAGLERQGLLVIAWLDGWGWRNMITTKRAVKRPEDLAGMKIRTIPTPLYLAALRMMGANPTPMAYGEIYTALQTGVIDGFEQAPSIVVAERFYEVAKNMAETRHLFGTMVICYSKAQWDRLSLPDQQSIRQAAATTQAKERALAPQREAEAMKTLRERGVAVHAIDTRGWEQAALKLQDQLAGERGAADLLGKIRAAAKP
ncbi:MAG: TRAP transporter substrate-binding protein [Opitutaceae bacterium]|nr:TRAP transporter substrate-binding protein [Opitutaceae bacterium]